MSERQKRDSDLIVGAVAALLIVAMVCATVLVGIWLVTR